MPLLRPGQPAPDLVLERLEGEPAPLSTYWGSGRRLLLLIFLRHLA